MADEAPRKRNALAQLLGAIFYGRRPDDHQARRKAKQLGALGLVFYLLLEMWSFTKRSVSEERKEHAEQEAALVLALKEQTGAMRSLTQRLEERDSRDAVFQAVVIERLAPTPAKVPAQRPVKTSLPPPAIEKPVVK